MYNIRAGSEDISPMNWGKYKYDYAPKYWTKNWYNK